MIVMNRVHLAGSLTGIIQPMDIDRDIREPTWVFEAVDEGGFSLHDCRPTYIEQHHGDIVFSFPDGFWLVKTNRQNPYRLTLQTGMSELVLSGATCDDATAHDWHTGKRRTVEWSDFVKMVNSGERVFEFVRQRHWRTSSRLTGFLKDEDFADHEEVTLRFTHDGVIYRWNEIREDQPWM